MLSSIHPLGERSRANRWSLTTSFYIAGSILGGLTTGLLMGVLGLAVRSVISAPAAVIILGGASALAVATDVGRIPPIIRGSRQVNEDWLMDYRGWVYGIGFGFQLGTGLMTIVPSMSVLITWLAAILSGQVWAAALIGSVFGFARAAVLLTTRRVDSPDRLRDFHRRIVDSGRQWRQITVGVLVLSSMTWIAMGVGG